MNATQAFLNAKTNLYEVRKQPKLALVIELGEEQLIGKGHRELYEVIELFYI